MVNAEKLDTRVDCGTGDAKYVLRASIGQSRRVLIRETSIFSSDLSAVSASNDLDRGTPHAG